MSLHKRLIIFFIFAIITSSSISPIFLIKAVQTPSTLWSKEYVPGEGHCVIQTADGGYAIAGVSDKKFLLLKTDSSGEVQWSRTYGDGIAYSCAYCVVQTSDGGYALAGQNNGDAFNFIKTDSIGNVQWSKAYAKPNASLILWIQSLIQISDGGYIIAGWSRDTFDDWVIKINANGNLEWNKTYGGGSYIGGISIVEADDGGYLLNTLHPTFEKTGLFMLIKIDLSGNVQWNKTGGFGGSLTKAKYGGYLMVGSSSLVKIDQHGNTVWSRLYPGETRIPYYNFPTSVLSSIAQAYDGGYIIAGYVCVSPFIVMVNKGVVARIIKTDADGDVEWTITYPPISEASMETPSHIAYSIIAANDGTCVFTGSKAGNVWLTKITLTSVTSIETSDITPPTIAILSPENKTYAMNNVSLTFFINEPTSWIGYSLDRQANVTITGNTTVTGLSESAHSLTVYANDTVGNMSASETVYFTVVSHNEPEQHERPSSPTQYTHIIVGVVTGIGIAVSIIFYRRKKIKTW
jgi:hypothetical protein